MFSVVIPLYNKQDSITSTLTSVLQQTFTDIEIIIVDDGSTDDSASKVLSFSDSRIKLVSKINGGVSSARNLGIMSATKSWIAFLDGDDVWKNDHLELIYDMITKYPKHKIFANSFVYSNDSREVGSRARNYYCIRDYFKEATNSHFIWTSVVVVEKETLVKVGMFNESLARGEDLDLWARLGKDEEIIKSDIITAVYRIEAENRACYAKVDLSKSIISTIDLKGKIGSERAYYKKLIYSKVFTLIRKELNIIQAFEIIARHNIELLR